VYCNAQRDKFWRCCDAAVAETILAELIEALRGEDSADQCKNAS